MEWLRGEEPGDDFYNGVSDDRGGESVVGDGVCEFGGKESGGGKEFDSAGGGGDDGSREGKEIPTAAMVKARWRCWVEEAILLGKSGFCVSYLFVFCFLFLNYFCNFLNEI